MFSIVTQVKGLIDYINDYYFTAGETCVWKDMPIYMSSFKEKDKRIVFTLRDRLLKYLRFFTKMITDDGLMRRMSVSRNFSNNSTDNNTSRNYYSETPQESLDNFETAIIQYASNLTKDTSNRNGTQSGNSSETATNLSWDEGMKNLRLVFYNDLVDFIAEIPNIVYNYYCLDSRPAPALVSEYYRSLIDLYRLENAR